MDTRFKIKWQHDFPDPNGMARATTVDKEEDYPVALRIFRNLCKTRCIITDELTERVYASEIGLSKEESPNRKMANYYSFKKVVKLFEEKEDRRILWNKYWEITNKPEFITAF